jgi:hypothetical protein
VTGLQVVFVMVYTYGLYYYTSHKMECVAHPVQSPQSEEPTQRPVKMPNGPLLHAMTTPVAKLTTIPMVEGAIDLVKNALSANTVADAEEYNHRLAVLITHCPQLYKVELALVWRRRSTSSRFLISARRELSICIASAGGDEESRSRLPSTAT